MSGKLAKEGGKVEGMGEGWWLVVGEKNEHD